MPSADTAEAARRGDLIGPDLLDRMSDPSRLPKLLRDWVLATRRRRRVAWLIAVLFMLFVFPGALGAVASAQAGSSGAAIDGVSWMGVRDSSGVPLANYVFATGHGGPLDPGTTTLWAVLGLLFMGYMTVVTAAIWLVGYALSFQWLDRFAAAWTGIADALTGQIATPIVLLTAATIGSVCVALFVARGYHAKAAVQVVTMLGVAVIGPVFLAEPLGDVLSSHGLLAQGRDVGISVAAGVNGNNDPDPARLVAGIQSEMADNFARKPVQVWNFGHVVDDRPSCRHGWTTAVLAGDDDRVRDSMRACGDADALAKAGSPSLGQVGTGLILLACAVLLLLFAAYLAIKVIKAAMGTIYHAFMSIFGFAAGGFVYGPTQTFLVRNIVDGLVAAARMTAFTIFLGIYVLFLGNVFHQAKGQVVAVMVIACVVEVAAIAQLRRLSAGLDRGNDWIAGRVASAIQRGGSAAGGPSASGMNMAAATSGSSGFAAVAAVSALDTVNKSPATAWLLGGVVNPLNPRARGLTGVERVGIQTAPHRQEAHAWNAMARQNWRMKALSESERGGGLGDVLGVAYALKGLDDSRVPDWHQTAALLDAGASDRHVTEVFRVRAAQQSSMSRNPFGFEPLQKAVSAALAVENHVSDDAHMAFAAHAVVRADSFARHTKKPPPGAAIDETFVARVLRSADSESAMRRITPDEWRNVSRETRWAIGQRVSQTHLEAARAYYRDPSDHHRAELSASARRIANLDHTHPVEGPDPWDS